MTCVPYVDDTQLLPKMPPELITDEMKKTVGNAYKILIRRITRKNCLPEKLLVFTQLDNKLVLSYTIGESSDKVAPICIVIGIIDETTQIAPIALVNLNEVSSLSTKLWHIDLDDTDCQLEFEKNTENWYKIMRKLYI